MATAIVLSGPSRQSVHRRTKLDLSRQIARHLKVKIRRIRGFVTLPPLSGGQYGQAYPHEPRLAEHNIPWVITVQMKRTLAICCERSQPLGKNLAVPPQDFRLVGTW